MIHCRNRQCSAGHTQPMFTQYSCFVLEFTEVTIWLLREHSYKPRLCHAVIKSCIKLPKLNQQLSPSVFVVIYRKWTHNHQHFWNPYLCKANSITFFPSANKKKNLLSATWFERKLFMSRHKLMTICKPVIWNYNVILSRVQVCRAAPSSLKSPCTIFCHRQGGLYASAAACAPAAAAAGGGGDGAVGTAHTSALPHSAQGHFETDSLRMRMASPWRTTNYPLLVRPGTFNKRGSGNYSRASFHH